MYKQFSVCVGFLAVGSSQISGHYRPATNAQNLSDYTSLFNTSTPKDEDPSTINLLNSSKEADPVWRHFLVNGFLILPLFSLASLLLILAVVRQVTVRTYSKVEIHTSQFYTWGEGGSQIS